MPSLLKRKKSKSSDDSSVTSTSTSLTSKSLKRSKAVGKSLRGFITKGKKKKKKSPESPLREVEESELGSDSDGKPLSFDDTEKTGFNEDIEDETVYGIKIEESQETAPRIEQPASSVDPLRLILLLLDPSSRRFELLQLEFDASRAHVIDVLNQIPLTATEDTLRNKQYRGLCNRAGTEMFKDGLLSECNIEDGVLVAIPRGLTSQESAKLASPILGDPKVLATFDDPEKQKKASLPRAEESKGTTTPEAAPQTAEMKLLSVAPTITPEMTERSIIINESTNYGSEKEGYSIFSRFFLLVFLLVALSPLLIHLQERHTAPMLPGDVLSPGEWKSTCGLLSILPTEWTGCHQAVLEMGRDRVLTFREGSEVVWSLTGGVCKADDGGCNSGAVFTESGEVRIGGVNLSNKLPKTSHSWPFYKES
mmetsp:Transcript_40160/g.58714  ORF Transcript_40160/g.58714 Transcript_40160/m.58714 type:complete len:423 (-) Transcript_40160:456-1724(-)